MDGPNLKDSLREKPNKDPLWGVIPFLSGD